MKKIDFLLNYIYYSFYKDKEKLVEWALANEAFKWILDAYPDTLIALRSMTTLPNGYLAVYRVSGPQLSEIDVFDPEGKYVCVLKAPSEILPGRTKFYDFGFSTLETIDDFPVYVEYGVKNLPEIFSQ